MFLKNKFLSIKQSPESTTAELGNNIKSLGSLSFSYPDPKAPQGYPTAPLTELACRLITLSSLDRFGN